MPNPDCRGDGPLEFTFGDNHGADSVRVKVMFGDNGFVRIVASDKNWATTHLVQSVNGAGLMCLAKTRPMAVSSSI